LQSKSFTFFRSLNQNKLPLPLQLQLQLQFKQYCSQQEKSKINKQFFNSDNASNNSNEINKMFTDLQAQYKNLKIKFNIICSTKETGSDIVKIVEKTLHNNDIKLIIALLKIIIVLIILVCLFVVGCVILINDTRI